MTKQILTVGSLVVFFFSSLAFGQTRFNEVGSNLRRIVSGVHDINASLSSPTSSQFYLFAGAIPYWTGTCFAYENQDSPIKAELGFDVTSFGKAVPDSVGVTLQIENRQTYKITTLSSCRMRADIMMRFALRNRGGVDPQSHMRACELNEDTGSKFLTVGMLDGKTVYASVRNIGWSYVPLAEDREYVCAFNPAKK